MVNKLILSVCKNRQLIVCICIGVVFSYNCASLITVDNSYCVIEISYCCKLWSDVANHCVLHYACFIPSEVITNFYLYQAMIEG